MTTEGRALTEVTMWIRNRAQPFMKVALPAGATMLSVEVAGSPAKPVEGKDGSRVPLLRPGFTPQGLYVVSFVYLHSGTPFLKKGDMQMTLPKMDVPVNVVEWELFVPDRFRVDRFAGDMFDAGLMRAYRRRRRRIGIGDWRRWRRRRRGVRGVRRIASAARPRSRDRSTAASSTQSGAPIPGVTVAVEAGGQRQTVGRPTRGRRTSCRTCRAARSR